MAKIVKLPQQLVNRIAAGEVVERPASVVKELLENSLDAGATRIAVDVEDGGKRLIRVSDNGGGIAREDLPLAVAPHATSKLLQEKDLYAIRTMGFRGEALASIASVSRVEIVSRPAEADEAGRLVVSAGQIEGPQPAAAAAGTIIAVRDLFFATPARRKFLRTTNTEMGHITEQFTRIALAHPQVHLILTHNGRAVHDLPAGQSLQQRIATAFNPELARDLIPIARQVRQIRISGLIAPPRHARSGTQWQYIFLNGRHIRDRFVGHAIKESYRGLLESNRQPVVFILLDMAPEAVDVNVHPAKTEVRFADSNAVHGEVLAAIRDRLLRTDLSVPVGDQVLSPATDASNADTEHQTNHRADQSQRVRQAMADFFQKAPPPSPAAPIHHRPDRSDRSAPGPDRFTGPAMSHPSIERETTDRFGPETANKSTPPPAIDPSPSVRPDPARPVDADAASIGPDDPARPPSAGPFLQVHNTYLVAQTENGLIIVDQHALHERILYEQLHRQAARGPLESQRCLIPETLDVTDVQMAALEDARGILRELGILIEPFGPRSIAIQGFPSLLAKVPPADFVADLLDVLIDQAGKVSKEQLLHELLDMMACKAAVKAGDPLSEQEISSLLAQRTGVERGGSCPHGRPTTIQLSLRQLEKQFKRT